MKWYLLSIGLISFIIYRGTKLGFNNQSVQNIVYNKSTSEADKKILDEQDRGSEINKNYLNIFNKTVGFYKLNKNYKTGLICIFCESDHVNFSLYDKPALAKDILNTSRPGPYQFNESFYPEKALLK